MEVSRRHLLGSFAATGVILGIPGLRTALAQSPASPATNASTRLVLLGTGGGPSPKPLRNYPANALIVNGEPYIIDCGNGIIRQLAQAKINYLKINKIFVTHHHDDHNADLGALMGFAWTNGRNTPIDAYGPPGTVAMLKAYVDYFRPNADIRTLDERHLVAPDEKFFRGHDVTEAGVIFQDANVKVTAAQNTHYPHENAELAAKHRSWAYRFDAADRSVVFSGDTTYSEGVIALAKGADILVHEVMHLDIIRGLARKQFVAQGRSPEEVEGVMKHVLETHTTMEMAGQVAAAAGVKTLVLNHLIPGPEPGVVSEDDYKEGVRKYFSGEIIVGKDLMSI